MRRGDSQNGRSPRCPRLMAILRRSYYQGALLARPLWWAPWPNQGYTYSNAQTLRFSHTTQVVFHGLCDVQLWVCGYALLTAVSRPLYPRSRRPVARNQPRSPSVCPIGGVLSRKQPHRHTSRQVAERLKPRRFALWGVPPPSPPWRTWVQCALAYRPLYQLACHGCDPTPHPSPDGAVAITRAPVTASRSTTFTRRFTPRCPPLI